MMRLRRLAALAFVLGPALAHFELVKPMGGFVAFALGGLLSLVGALATVVRLVRGRGWQAGDGFSFAVGIGFVAVAVAGGNAPRINDFTTDASDPPRLVLAATYPENAGRDMSYPAEFEAQQRACCADLRPAKLSVAPGVAFERAKAAAERRDAWVVTAVDPAAGTIEATAVSAVFRFRDDLVIRVRPDGTGSRVDIRSKSRDGKGDIGANAARIRSFVATLEATR